MRSYYIIEADTKKKEVKAYYDFLSIVLFWFILWKDHLHPAIFHGAIDSCSGGSPLACTYRPPKTIKTNAV
jgi:hypothetical protein